MLPFALSSCLITEVIQSDQVGTLDLFTTKITVVDSLSDPNAWRGTVSVMIPENWEFYSGSYEGDIGAGSMELRTKWDDIVAAVTVSKTDSIRPPDPGMRWIDLVSDSAYGYEGPVTNSISINLRTSADTGRFNIGYIVSKDAFPYARDVLGFWDDGSADSLFNQEVLVYPLPTINLELEEPRLDQVFVYPNPSSKLIHLQYDSLEFANQISKLKIYDIQGRSVEDLVTPINSSLGSSALNVERLSPGRYILELSSGGETQHQIIVIR